MRDKTWYTRGMIVLVLLGVAGTFVACDDDKKYEKPPALATVSFEIAPPVGYPWQESPFPGGLWRWETMLYMAETGGRSAQIVGAKIQFFRLDGTMEWEHAVDLMELFGTDTIVPRGKLVATYEIKRQEPRGYYADFIFDVVRDPGAANPTTVQLVQRFKGEVY
jgi:hypothetical protein